MSLYTLVVATEPPSEGSIAPDDPITHDKSWWPALPD